MLVTPHDVRAFLGQEAVADDASLAAHLTTTTAMVRAYTRDRGFDVHGEPADDVAAVIVSCTARQIHNPTHTVSVTIDDAAVRQGMFHGWTLPELAILHRYRVRAQ